MVVDISNRLINCPSLDVFAKQAKTLLEADSAEVWISQHGYQDEIPCLSLLVNYHEYVINYFGIDGSNYASIGNDDDERLLSFCNGQYTIAGYQVISQEIALTVIRDLYQTFEPSKAISWKQL